MNSYHNSLNKVTHKVGSSVTLLYKSGTVYNLVPPISCYYLPTRIPDCRQVSCSKAPCWPAVEVFTRFLQLSNSFSFSYQYSVLRTSHTTPFAIFVTNSSHRISRPRVPQQDNLPTPVPYPGAIAGYQIIVKSTANLT